MVPVLGQPSREPAVQQGRPVGEIEPAVQQGLPVGEIEPAVQQGLPAQGSMVEAGPVSCGGRVPSPNNAAPPLPFSLDTGPPGGSPPGGSGNGSGGGVWRIGKSRWPKRLGQYRSIFRSHFLLAISLATPSLVSGLLASKIQKNVFGLC